MEGRAEVISQRNNEVYSLIFKPHDSGFLVIPSDERNTTIFERIKPVTLNDIYGIWRRQDIENSFTITAQDFFSNGLGVITSYSYENTNGSNAIISNDNRRFNISMRDEHTIIIDDETYILISKLPTTITVGDIEGLWHSAGKNSFKFENNTLRTGPRDPSDKTYKATDLKNGIIRIDLGGVDLTLYAILFNDKNNLFISMNGKFGIIFEKEHN